MPFFACRLNPPRPSFPLDMSDAERGLMGRHVAYWGEVLARGEMVIFGPVIDPAETWGLGIAEAASEAEARALTEADPVMRADAGFSYTIMAMPNAIARPAVPTT